MAAIVRVHRPTLSQKEREYRMEQLRKATIECFRELREKEKEQNA